MRFANAALALLLPWPACIPSNVVARDDRMVTLPVAELPWTPAKDLQLDGLYESVELTGEAAVTLRGVWYHFAPDGKYTGAALTEGDGRHAFQTLTGTWQQVGPALSLDGAPPVPVETAPDHLRLTAPNGVLVLRRCVRR